MTHNIIVIIKTAIISFRFLACVIIQLFLLKCCQYVKHGGYVKRCKVNLKTNQLYVRLYLAIK